MKRKGFTLVELLAVIAILAILVIIALPNVMGMFNTAKENSFKTEVKEVYKAAQNQWMQDSMYKNAEVVYSRCSSGCSNPLDLSGRSDFEYYIKVDKSGKISEYYATDGTFQYSYNEGDLKIESINSAQKVADLPDNRKLSVTSSGVLNKPLNTNEKRFCVIYSEDNIMYYSFTKNSTWDTYIGSSNNTTFAEYINHNNPTGKVTTISSSTNVCGSTNIRNEDFSEVLLTDTIKEESSGCYIYAEIGIC